MNNSIRGMIMDFDKMEKSKAFNVIISVLGVCMFFAFIIAGFISLNEAHAKAYDLCQEQYSYERCVYLLR